MPWTIDAQASLFKNDSESKDASQELIAGGVAGGIAKTSVAPLERTKILFQVSETFTL